MKKILFIQFTLLLLAACNGNKEDTSSDKTSVNTDSLLAQQEIRKIENDISQNPDSIGLRLKLVYALDSINNHKEALAQIDSLVQKDKSNYGLWFTRGQVAENAGDTLTALESYATAAKIYESPDALLSLANLYAETKNERAITICSRVKALGQGRETDADCDFVAGIYYARTGNADAAITFFNKCISENYTYMEAYIEKGMVYFDKKDYAHALEVFNFASTVDNMYADAAYYQARCYEMMNKKDSAILKFNQSLALDKNLKEAREGLERLNAGN